RNIANFLALVVKDGELAPDFDDEIVVGTCVVKAGTVVHGPTAEALGLPAPAPAAPAPPEATPTAAEGSEADPSTEVYPAGGGPEATTDDKEEETS
ncbi:MAG TPA: hypothetical protein VHT49_03485, partial [Acidimicrobiales bacterium]|nr:hypothetical protein [Acidimicrobiales bacterium]